MERSPCPIAGSAAGVRALLGQADVPDDEQARPPLPPVPQRLSITRRRESASETHRKRTESTSEVQLSRALVRENMSDKFTQGVPGPRAAP